MIPKFFLFLILLVFYTEKKFRLANGSIAALVVSKISMQRQSKRFFHWQPQNVHHCEL